jgi:hypothetical protein
MFVVRMMTYMYVCFRSMYACGLKLEAFSMQRYVCNSIDAHDSKLTR